jgi:hypothetical protein
VQISPAPLGHGSERSSITVFRRYVPDDILAMPRPSPHVGKAKEVESRPHSRRVTPMWAFEPEVDRGQDDRHQFRLIVAPEDGPEMVTSAT